MYLARKNVPSFQGPSLQRIFKLVRCSSWIVIVDQGQRTKVDKRKYWNGNETTPDVLIEERPIHNEAFRETKSNVVQWILRSTFRFNIFYLFYCILAELGYFLFSSFTCWSVWCKADVNVRCVMIIINKSNIRLWIPS